MSEIPERLRLLLALRSRCKGDSKGFFDYDVAEWFDHDSHFVNLPSGEETPGEYDEALKPFIVGELETEAKVAEQAATIQRLEQEIADNEFEWSAAHDINTNYTKLQADLATARELVQRLTSLLTDVELLCRVNAAMWDGSPIHKAIKAALTQPAAKEEM